MYTCKSIDQNFGYKDEQMDANFINRCAESRNFGNQKASTTLYTRARIFQYSTKMQLGGKIVEV